MVEISIHGAILLGLAAHEPSGGWLHLRGCGNTPAAERRAGLCFWVDTGGRHSMMEQLLPHGSGPGPHKHTWSDETFYILEGELTFLVGEEIQQARKGDYLMVPRNTRHAFRVDSETVRFLNGYTPASLEALIIEQATPAPERVLPLKGTTQYPAMNPELLRRYGMDVLPGPDPLRPEGD